MRRLYTWAGGRKVFQAYLFVVLVLGITAAYSLAGRPPDFEWVISPLSLALLGTQVSISAEDSAKAKAIGTVASALGAAQAGKTPEDIDA